jgi:peptidyl-prolyl cis-trans isomerase B (cyclophilin B)
MRILSILLLSTTFACQEQKTDSQVVISTNFGEMTFELSSEAPLHKENFIKEIKRGTWEKSSFNRIVKDFVIQAGCPDLEDGTIDADHWIDAEFSENLKHHFGALGMGRDANAEKRSANCQFYIVTNDEGLPRLDGGYTIFGYITSGEDVLRALNQLAETADIQEIPFSISLK